MKQNCHFRKEKTMSIDKNFNIHDYKEETMIKYNLTEEEWNDIVDLANIFKQCDDISIVPPFTLQNNL